jgi:hypothetical protein
MESREAKKMSFIADEGENGPLSARTLTHKGWGLSPAFLRSGGTLVLALKQCVGLRDKAKTIQ